MRYRILSAAAFLLCGSVVMAEDKLALPFADADDLPTVLSATRLNQSLFDAPAAVTVIDRQMIEQSGVREIPEILRMVPGMVVGYESGSEAFVSYHGTSADLARRMQVLVENLLELARLESGPVKLQQDWQALEEILGAALAVWRRALAPRAIRVELPDVLPLVRFELLLHLLLQ